jgi:hypothetical protein
MMPHHGHEGHSPGASPLEQIDVMHSQHAFFLVGGHHLFMVHMVNAWMDCHRYQMILKVSLPQDVVVAWREDQRRNPQDWYVVGNLKHNLLSLPDLQRGSVTGFQASLWRSWPKSEGSPSWPWSNERPIVEAFDVTVERVVYFRRLDFNADYPRTASYVLFGKGTECHLNHMPVKQPDYDHVVTLGRAPSWVPPSLLETGIPINFPSIPAVPGGHSCREAVFANPPFAVGQHFVQYGGLDRVWPLEVDRHVFFGSFPFNRSKPGKEWRPCPTDE